MTERKSNRDSRASAPKRTSKSSDYSGRKSSDERPKRAYTKRDNNNSGFKRRFNDDEAPRRKFNSDERPKRTFTKRDDNNSGFKRRFNDDETPRRKFNSDERPKRAYTKRDDNNSGFKRRFNDDETPRRKFNSDERPKRTFTKREDNNGGFKRRFNDDEAPRRKFNSDERPKRTFTKRDDNNGGFKRRFNDNDETPRRRFDSEERPRNYVRSSEPEDSRLRRQTKERKAKTKVETVKDVANIRLNKFIANSGVCSRREADTLINAGVVSVNGIVVTELGVKISASDEIRFNGELLHGEKKVYLVMNKPKGFVTTVDDPHADKTVMDIVRNYCSQRIYPVGRLDKNTTGVLLFTNDGELTKVLTHPSYGKKKIYSVSLDKNLTKNDLARLAEGVELEDGLSFFDEIAYADENDKCKIGVEIHSGKNRIVRRMFEHLGYKVTKLDRVYFAGLTKSKLRRGDCRFLSEVEINSLKMGSYE